MDAARFETLIGHHDELSERRRRLMTSALMAAVLSLSAGTMAWVGGKLGISAVAPPSNAYQVTFQVAEVPPPPSPPPAPRGGLADGAKDDEPSTPDEIVPEPKDEAPPEVAPLDLEARPRRSTGVPTDGTGKGPAGRGLGPGIGPGGPSSGTCLLPPCVGTTTIATTRPRIEPPPVPTARAPIDTVMGTSIFAPDPDPRALASTPTGRSHRQSGRSSVSFCIDKGGKTFDVRTRTGFRGDAEVDRICRQTVSKWRFKPMRVGGQARTTCTTVTFDIRFE